MKNKGIIKIFSVFLLVVLVSISSFVLADAGNINRYNDSSSSSSSSSSYYDSSDSGSSSDYSSSRNYSGSSSSKDHLGSISPSEVILLLKTVGLVIASVVVLQIVMNKIFKKIIRSIVPHSDTHPSANVITDTKGISEQIRQTDPAFSEENFLSWTKDVFIKLQAAWTARDWKIIRPFESNELFEQHNLQLQEYINNNRIDVIERLNVQSADIMSYKVDGDKEIIEVYLRAVMKDYIIDATTKNVVEGNKDTDWNMKYKLTFARKNGVKTQVGTSNKSTTNCPNCGAPTQITSAGQCEYCGSVITTGEHDWVLTGLEGIK